MAVRGSEMVPFERALVFLEALHSNFCSIFTRIMHVVRLSVRLSVTIDIMNMSVTLVDRGFYPHAQWAQLAPSEK